MSELLPEIPFAANFLIVKRALEVMALELAGLLTSHLYVIIQTISLSCICATKEFHNIPPSDLLNLYDGEDRLPSHLFISSSH